ncbi:protein smg7l [Phtheirospermum japonicum]|uniref:Protein smg7l n=1 Tax=Phtheirospermum japonicum TaxID=374723 RepID=A0A830CM61_9LAMI|nr:protein smg7l [Phtheirospermum japonicum]
MLALINSKGILDNDVLELYRKIRTGYEKTLLDSNQKAERQEVEYHLWRLHYQLIDELRKNIKRRSYNNEEHIKNNNPPGDVNSESTSDKGFKGFMSFLSEANEFYKKLIVKLRENCELDSVEPEKVRACEHTCHRLLICLGDLARYTEIVKKPDACEWSTSATYYLEATRTWPDSGNPHNQLALLATYVGDAFLALYHCVRSLAVKEPFPDAWRNIMLLFEENRSTKLPSFFSEMQLDFLNPSKKSYLQNTTHEDNNNINSPHNSKLENPENFWSEKSDLWPLLVRTLSFLLIRSSLDEFPCSLASALHCLEALLEIDDTKLSLSLESYQSLDSSRRGPYRAIQLVSIFIFIVHSLTESPERDESKLTGKNHETHSTLKPLAFSAIFICMGRLTERCLNRNNPDICPLLPAVLVFTEWLVGAIDTVETYDTDERVKNALSYFYGTLADLLDRVEKNGDETDLDYTALWEDHELRGFYPLSRVHETLDFETHHECMDDYSSSKNKSRFQRMFHAAKRIREVSKSFRLVNPAKSTKKFDRPKADEVREPDEEVIVFKPITRRNSAPVYISELKTGPTHPSRTKTQQTDELLRRATSLSAGPKIEDTDSFSFQSTAHPTGPPSLSAWNIEIENGPHVFSKHKLSPIDEIVSTSLVDLSVHESPPRATPVPSAPLLPDDAVWSRANPSFLPECKNEADGILGAAPITSGYPIGRSANRPPVGFVDGYPPFLGMSSSEWLYHYRNSQNMSGNNISPIHFNTPSFVNYQSNELSGFDLCDQWGNHFVSSPMMYLGSPTQLYADSSVGYGVEGQKRDYNYVLGYQRSFPYEEPTLLQYLKEKERQLQPGSQLRGPSFMGN